MGQIRIGILGAADIAKRRFLPALSCATEISFVGIAVATAKEHGEEEGSAYEAGLPEKYKIAAEEAEKYGGRCYESYEALLTSEDVDAVYIPLPPALHVSWAMRALECGKHVLVEKPSAISSADTEKMIRKANEKKLAICENYGFCFHKQMDAVKEIISSGEIGELRLVRAAFGFPYRNANDFRYKKELGGGALLDCGGYTLKAARNLLGDSAKLRTARLNGTGLHDVDMYGSATLENEKGLVAQVSFGMDNEYYCELEVWGSKGSICAPRFFTPPPNVNVILQVKKQTVEERSIECDDVFLHTIQQFAKCVCSEEERRKVEAEMLAQMKMVDEVKGVTDYE